MQKPGFSLLLLLDVVDKDEPRGDDYKTTLCLHNRTIYKYMSLKANSRTSTRDEDVIHYGTLVGKSLSHSMLYYCP